MNPAEPSSPINWTMIEYGTGVFFLYWALYYPGAQLRKRLSRKNWPAAPMVPARQIGGKAWWPVWLKPEHVCVVTAWAGWSLYFAGYPKSKAIGIAFGLMAFSVAMMKWIWPSWVGMKRAYGEWQKKRGDDDQSPRFPAGDDADFRVVDPFQPPDSGSHPWWRRPRGTKGGASA